MIFLRRVVSALVVTGLIGVTFVACSSDKKATPPDDSPMLALCELPVACQDIVRACHPKDDGAAGEIHECHETAHDVGIEAQCVQVHDSCLTTCNAAPKLSGAVELKSCGDAGAGDAAVGDAG